MAIDTPHLVQCEGCNRYLPPSGWLTIPSNWGLAARFEDGDAAVACAKQRGWIDSGGDIACPDCQDLTVGVQR